MSVRYSKNTNHKTRSSHPTHKAGLNGIGKAIGQAGTYLFKWAITDHTGVTTALLKRPSTHFLEDLRYTIGCIALHIGLSILRILLLAVLYALWIPFMLWAVFWCLHQ